MWFVCSNKINDVLRTVRNDFFFHSQKGWETFQTILEHPLEHKMKVHEEQYASCLFFFFL